MSARAWHGKAIQEQKPRMVEGQLGGRKKCESCGKTATTLPVSGTRNWIKLEPKPVGKDGDYAVEHGEAVIIRNGDRPLGYRYRRHECALTPTPQSHAEALFDPNPAVTPQNPESGLSGASHDHAAPTESEPHEYR